MVQYVNAECEFSAHECLIVFKNIVAQMKYKKYIHFNSYVALFPSYIEHMDKLLLKLGALVRPTFEQL